MCSFADVCKTFPLSINIYLKLSSFRTTSKSCTSTLKLYMFLSRPTLLSLYSYSCNLEKVKGFQTHSQLMGLLATCDLSHGPMNIPTSPRAGCKLSLRDNVYTLSKDKL